MDESSLLPHLFTAVFGDTVYSIILHTAAVPSNGARLVTFPRACAQIPLGVHILCRSYRPTERTMPPPPPLQLGMFEKK